MENMQIYEATRSVPKEATKPIKGGRLSGMTDINPMWRIKVLTEQFGPCGIGWYYTVDRQWVETIGNEAVAFVNISLYIKCDGEWSKPIFGTGGSKLATMEKSGLYVSDEAFKMATTDAISVSCKQLGLAADIYWSGDRTKYSDNPEADETAGKKEQKKSTPIPSGYPKRDEMIRVCEEHYKGDNLKALLNHYKRSAIQFLKNEELVVAYRRATGKTA